MATRRPPDDPYTEAITTRLSEEQVATLDRLARQQGIPRATLLREIVAAYLNTRGTA